MTAFGTSSSDPNHLSGILVHILHPFWLLLAVLFALCWIAVIVIRFRRGANRRLFMDVPYSNFGGYTEKSTAVLPHDQENGSLEQNLTGFMQRSFPSKATALTEVAIPVPYLVDTEITPDSTTSIRRHSYPAPNESHFTRSPTRLTYTRHLPISDASRHPGVIVRGQVLHESGSRRHVKVFEPLNLPKQLDIGA